MMWVRVGIIAGLAIFLVLVLILPAPMPTVYDTYRSPSSESGVTTTPQFARP